MFYSLAGRTCLNVCLLTNQYFLKRRWLRDTWGRKAVHLNNWQPLYSPNPPREGKLIRNIYFGSVACVVNMHTIRTKGNSRCPLSIFLVWVSGNLLQVLFHSWAPLGALPLLVLSFCHRLLCSWRIRFIPAIWIAVFLKTTNNHEPLQWHFVLQKDLALSCTVTDFVVFTHVKNTWFVWWATTLIPRGELEGGIPQHSQGWARPAHCDPYQGAGSHLDPDCISARYFQFPLTLIFDLFIHNCYPEYSTWTRFWHFESLITSLTGKPTLIVSKIVWLLSK